MGADFVSLANIFFSDNLLTPQQPAWQLIPIHINQVCLEGNRLEIINNPNESYHIIVINTKYVGFECFVLRCSIEQLIHFELSYLDKLR